MNIKYRIFNLELKSAKSAEIVFVGGDQLEIATFIFIPYYLPYVENSRIYVDLDDVRQLAAG